MPTAPALSRIRRIRKDAEIVAAELARVEATRDLLARLRAYLLADGHALAPDAGRLAAEINDVIGTET